MTSPPGGPVAITWLFASGDRPVRFAKAARSGADEVICDLEDSVAEDRKGQARRHVADWLARRGRAWVRVNAAATSHTLLGRTGETLISLAARARYCASAAGSSLDPCSPS